MKAALALLLVLPALAQAFSCEGVGSADQQAYCRAIRSNSANSCSTIRNYDLRQTCRVRLGSTPAICNTTSNGFARNECKAVSKGSK